MWLGMVNATTDNLIWSLSTYLDTEAIIRVLLQEVYCPSCIELCVASHTHGRASCTHSRASRTHGLASHINLPSFISLFIL